MTEDRMSVPTQVELARHDERIKALGERITAAEGDMERRLQVAAIELSRRLDGLNHDLAQRQEMLTHTVNIDKFNGLKEQFDEFKGRLWLPMIIIAGIAAGVAAAITAIAR